MLCFVLKTLCILHLKRIICKFFHFRVITPSKTVLCWLETPISIRRIPQCQSVATTMKATTTRPPIRPSMTWIGNSARNATVPSCASSCRKVWMIPPSADSQPSARPCASLQSPMVALSTNFAPTRAKASLYMRVETLKNFLPPSGTPAQQPSAVRRTGYTHREIISRRAIPKQPGPSHV